MPSLLSHLGSVPDPLRTEDPSLTLHLREKKPLSFVRRFRALRAFGPFAVAGRLPAGGAGPSRPAASAFFPA